LNSLLGPIIGMLLFTIIFLDHPFAGQFGIKPASYKQIFTMEQWSKELKEKN
jgi:ABC-type anion transport system duplicated permease subunit